MEEREIWSGIREDYLAGEMTVREIAEKWQVSENRIYKKATSDGWKKLKEKIRQKTEEKYVARASRLRARELEVISTAAGKMANLLDRTVEELGQEPPEKRVKNLKGMSALASAIYANTETMIKLYGIQTPAQEAAQKLARQRLALDQRKQRFEEGKAAEESKDTEVQLTMTIRSAEEARKDAGEEADQD